MPCGDRDPNSDDVQSVNPNPLRLSVPSFYFGSDRNNPSNPSEEEYGSVSPDDLMTETGSDAKQS